MFARIRARPRGLVAALLVGSALLAGCGGASDEVVSIAVLGDTQMMTEPAPRTLAGRFEGETSWLQSHADAFNLKLVLQLGDLTNGTYKEGGYTTPATNTLGLTEMAYAKRAMDKLWLPKTGRAVPWTVSLGNHDIDQWCWGSLLSEEFVSKDPRCDPGGTIVDGRGTTRTTSNFQKAIPRDYFTPMPTWGGSMSETNVDDNYHRFSVDGQGWLVVALLWAPQQQDFDWANSLITAEVAANPGLRVILATHGFIHPAWDGNPATLPSGVPNGNARELYENVIKAHPQIRLVLSGHWATPITTDPARQCLDPVDTATFKPCQWVRKHTVEVPAAGSVPSFTFHTLLTDYSYNGDPRRKTFALAPPDKPGGPAVTLTRSIASNAFFRLLTIDGPNKTIRVRTLTDPSNLAAAPTPPAGCAPVSLRDFDLDEVVCGKTDEAYGTSQDDYILDYK